MAVGWWRLRDPTGDSGKSQEFSLHSETQYPLSLWSLLLPEKSLLLSKIPARENSARAWNQQKPDLLFNKTHKYGFSQKIFVFDKNIKFPGLQPVGKCECSGEAAATISSVCFLFIYRDFS